jgi:hypothetical protein
MATKNNVTGWVGWIFFAGFMMTMLGTFQMIAGLTVLFNSDWLVTTESKLLLLDFSTWGWTYFLLGLTVLLAGFGVMKGSAWARVVGVLIALGSAAANLASVNIYPIWSVITIAVSVLVIFALTVHGDEVKVVE